MAPTALSVAKDLHGYRKVVVPEPEILPACKNCKHFRYDSDDRENFKGWIILRKVKLRCVELSISVHNNCVCNKHVFCYNDRRDK